jgi:hypothetical protein
MAMEHHLQRNPEKDILSSPGVSNTAWVSTSVAATVGKPFFNFAAKAAKINEKHSCVQKYGSKIPSRPEGQLERS